VTADDAAQAPEEIHQVGSDDPLLARVRAALEVIGLDPARVTPRARLVDDLGLDSLDWVDLAQRLEDELAVCVVEERLASVATIADVVALLRARLDLDRPDPGAP
jgi:acyl carrier protein